MANETPRLHALTGPGEGLQTRCICFGLCSTLILCGSAGAQENAVAIELEPITVTGEKTVRTLDTTSSSVSVLTDEDLDERPGLATLDEVLSQLPSVLATGTGNLAPQIRGSDTTGPAQGVTAFIAGTRPRTTMQGDGRPLTYNEFVFGQTGLWDVERVEVFRGPQTTLQGRNSIAGAIVIETKDPTFDFEAGGRAVVGNYDTRQFSGEISGPIVEDQLAFRLAADRRDHESYVDLTGDVGVDDPKEDRYPERNLRRDANRSRLRRGDGHLLRQAGLNLWRSLRA